MANQDCKECGGEGVQWHQTSVDDGYDVPCDSCFPNTSWEDLFIDPDGGRDD